MIDNRLIFNMQNPILDNIISNIPKLNIDKYINNSNLVDNVTANIYKNENIDKIFEHFSDISISEEEKYVFLGYITAKTINDKNIENIFNHLNWLDWLLSNNSYISESYFYYIKSFLEDDNFLLNYITTIKQYYEYCNKNPDKLLLPHRFDKKYALKILEEWNNVTEYSKIIAGDWKNFYDSLFFDSSYYFIKPLIDTKSYKEIVEILLQIENFFIIDNLLSDKSIAFNLDFLLNILNEIKDANDKFNFIKFLIINKIQDYLTCLYRKIDNIIDEIKIKIVEVLETLNNQYDKYNIYKHWLKALTNKIIGNSEIDLSILLIESIAKQLVKNDLIDLLKNELINDNKNPYESLMLLILLEDSPVFNKNHYELLKNYLLEPTQYIYVNLCQANKAFEPRFYYLSQLFIGDIIGEEEWFTLWKLLYKERKENIYPYFYKNNSKSMYRSIFLIITGIAATQYLCEENKSKTSKFLNYIWEATKEIYLFNSRFYDNLTVEIIFRLVILSNIIGEEYIKYLDFIKYNPTILTQVLTSLQHNGYNISSLKEDKLYFESVNMYVTQLMNKEHISQEYQLLCENVLLSLK